MFRSGVERVVEVGCIGKLCGFEVEGQSRGRFDDLGKWHMF